MHTKHRLLSSALLPAVSSSSLVQALLILALVPLNQIFNVAATIGFAYSGMADSPASFLLWQIVGSLFGFGTQITFAGMVRFFSLRFANAIGIGMAFFSAQFFGAYLLSRILYRCAVGRHGAAVPGHPPDCPWILVL